MDVKGVPELNELCYDDDSGLTIGAAVECYRIYSDEKVAAKYPGLIDSASLIGGIQIQGRGIHRRQPVQRNAERRHLYRC